MKNPFASDHSVTISPLSIMFGVLFVLSLYFLYYVRNVVAMVFVAVIVMAALNPSVSKLERKLKIPRIIGILMMYVLVVTLLVLTVAIVIPPLVSELQQLSRYVDLFPIQEQLRNFKFTLSEVNGLVNSLGGSFTTLLGIITSTFSGIFTTFTVVVMSFYLLIDRKNLYRKVAWFTRHPRHLELAQEFVDSTEGQLGGWIRGQVILMVVIGFVTYLGLLVLGVPYPVPLAILAGLLEILPNIGPTVAAMPSIALAFLYGGWVFAGVTTLFYIVVQQLENNVIVPKIMQRNANVNPLATIITILIGLKLAGVVGAILAVPLYIVIRNLYSMWLREFGHHQAS